MQNGENRARSTFSQYVLAVQKSDVKIINSNCSSRRQAEVRLKQRLSRHMGRLRTTLGCRLRKNGALQARPEVVKGAQALRSSATQSKNARFNPHTGSPCPVPAYRTSASPFKDPPRQSITFKWTHHSSSAVLPRGFCSGEL